MGRECGFVAVHATLAAGDVDVCLIPEVPFDMDKLFEYVETNLESKGHCLIVVAEGAGQEYFEGVDLGTDLSGNKKLPDVASYIKERAKSWFKGTPSAVHRTLIDRNSNRLPTSPFLGQLPPFCGTLKPFSPPLAMIKPFSPPLAMITCYADVTTMAYKKGMCKSDSTAHRFRTNRQQGPCRQRAVHRPILSSQVCTYHCVGQHLLLGSRR
jgi:hypothetical protein